MGGNGSDRNWKGISIAFLVIVAVGGEWETDRQTDVQTDRQTYRQTDRHLPLIKQDFVAAKN